MKISILTDDFSRNSFHRPYVLANALNHKYDVEIVGPIFGNSVYEPCRQPIVKYKIIKGRWFPLFFASVKELLASIEGDVIYASKLMLPSFGVGLLKKKTSKRPLVLDIDDWSAGLWLGEWHKTVFKRFVETYYRNPFKLLNPTTHIYKVWMEHFATFADQITVTSDFLQRRFGGIKLPHARDPQEFNPQRFDAKELRKQWSIDRFKIIMFIGNPAPYKGIEELVDAIELVDRKDLKLMLVGINTKMPYSKQIIKRGGEHLITKPHLISVSDVPKVLAMADLVVIPQRNTPSTVGQIPAKLIDAMAMAKPIIATNVSDMPKILDGCGIIVEPNDVEALAERIAFLLDNPVAAAELGKKAREKFLGNYTLDHLQKQLTNIFESFV